MDENKLKEFGRRLLEWYGEHRRDLPWRRAPTPYRVLVSEVMLQQTAVATAEPYFAEWMERFPDVASLAAATEREVLSLWEGMGYYRRATRLLEAARMIVERHGGRVPEQRGELLELPGVGPYIADAVLSLAHGRDAVALDVNVCRVFMRLLGIEGRTAETAVRRRARNAAAKALPRGRAADYNQALMDFGSLICRPRRPLCGDCPFSETCAAYREGRQLEIPRRKRREVTRIRTAVALLVRDGEVYIQKRPPGGLFAGMWEFPGGKAEDGETPREAVVRECREELGVQVQPGGKLTELTHYYTVFEVRLHAFLCEPPEGLPEDETHQWVPLEELGDYPMPSANRQVVQELEAHPGEEVRRS